VRPDETGRRYDRIAAWWCAREPSMTAGVEHVRRALRGCRVGGRALDVGCGGGGRLVDLLVEAGLSVHGIDVSPELVERARGRHPSGVFEVEDAVEWAPREAYAFILAWDSLFHVGLEDQAAVVRKLATALEPGGVLLMTAGGVRGRRSGAMAWQTFEYASLGANEYERLLGEAGLVGVAIERDQAPEDHIVIQARRPHA
jgi:2-polyprenyl-3-methyl-5-hydroxy-6-metoxy-1,4-benzoquinol methylase